MIIDVNVSYGFWPFQILGPDTPKKLAVLLTDKKITHALVSPVEAILYPDPVHYNERLFSELEQFSALLPVMVLNPSLKGWKSCLERFCGKAFGVKIVPNYHCYSLHEQFIHELILELRELNLPLFIQMRIEDERNQYPLMKVPGLCVEEIIAFARMCEDHPVICLNAYYQEAIELVSNTSNVYVDTAFIEVFETMTAFVSRIPPERILFGSHTPFLYTTASLMKMKDKDISSETVQKIQFKNAEKLLRIE